MFGWNHNPAYDTTTQAGNIPFFTASAVFLFESKKAGRYSCIKKKGKHEQISTVTVFSRLQNTPTAGYQGVFQILIQSIDLHVPCSPFWPYWRQLFVYETAEQEEDSMEGPAILHPPKCLTPYKWPCLTDRVVKSPVFQAKNRWRQKTWGWGSGFFQQFPSQLLRGWRTRIPCLGV